MEDKHPTETLKELDTNIEELENLVSQQANILEINKAKLDKLKYKKQSFLNYLNDGE
ncbi:hypothetical protein UFOVP87_47 [uncultured Caudovirales phage]|uniref:Uncharacterized protein n=1 Tax=uncultured Caudovirales phage TaxID=2100421 RepID=A0A6J5L0P7_9CAUD|nr:hypothetical protein UFOVP87_47 [uncultured Caudovirales phage]